MVYYLNLEQLYKIKRLKLLLNQPLIIIILVLAFKLLIIIKMRQCATF
jgi:hypothetical protein